MEKKEKKEMIASYKERKVKGGVYTIKNTVNGKILLLATTDLSGAKNRFRFAKETGGCLHIRLQKDWENFGAEVFELEILDELVKKENQTQKDFKDDIEELLVLWLDKIDEKRLY